MVSLTRLPETREFPPDSARFRTARGGRQHIDSQMPWEGFARMRTEDIGAFYEYLPGLEPQDGPVGEPMFKKAN